MDERSEGICELCGSDFLVSTVIVSIDPTEDMCVRESAEVCVRCLIYCHDNIELMVEVVQQRLAIEEKIETEIEEYSDT